MRTLVVYDTSFGNTEQVARALGERLIALGDVEVTRADTARLDPPPDLLLVGGPTQYHGASKGLRALLNALPRHALDDVPTATFDTRYRYPRFLSGSAATAAAKGLERAGCRLVVPPESFFVEEVPQPEGTPKPAKGEHHPERLVAGELERAVAWAGTVADAAVRPA
jgi:flavodoxin